MLAPSITAIAAAIATVTALASPAVAHRHHPDGVGAPGVGDPYFPLDGNGGYDVRHYDLDSATTRRPTCWPARATITAPAPRRTSRASTSTSTGSTVRRVTVNGAAARGSRTGGELGHPASARWPRARASPSVVRYAGVPGADDPDIGLGGFIPTDDGFVIAGEPHGAATLVPGQRPPDRQGDLHLPRHRAARPRGRRQRRARLDEPTSGRPDDLDLDAASPMASLPRHGRRRAVRHHAYQRDGVRLLRRRRPGLLDAGRAPRTGAQFALSQAGDPSYKRLTRTIDVPAGGAQLSFCVNRDTEPTGTTSSSRRTPSAWTTGRRCPT